MISKQTLTNLCLGSSLVAALMTVGTESAQALTWTLKNAFLDDGITPIVGSFTINNESGSPPNLTVSNITVSGITFTQAEVVAPLESPLEAVDWINLDGDSLTLAFTSALTPLGGTIALDDFLSDFNGSTISGEVVADVVPEPLTLLGAGAAIAFGAGFKRKRQG